jgi:hypothetical protein
MPRFLLRDLATIGARTTDDAPVASGFVTAYVPGTTRLAVVYVDATTDQARAQPILLDETGKATLWVDAPVRLLIQAANGTTVFDGDPADTIVAAAVTLENTGWPASLDVNAALTALYASLGGLDGNHRPDPAAIDLAVSQWMREVCVSVKSFGATGDGLTDDRNAIVAAYTAVAQHTIKGGRGTLFFPAGVYRMGASFPIGDSGIRIVGSGIASTFLEFFAGDGSGMVINGPDGLDVAHLTVRFDGDSSGIGIDIQDGARLRFERVGLSITAGVGFDKGVRLSPTTADIDGVTLEDCDIAATTNALYATGGGIDDEEFGLRDLRVLGGRLESGDIQAQMLFFEHAEFDGVRFKGANTGINFGSVAHGAIVTDCNFRDRSAGPDIALTTGSNDIKTWGNRYSTGGGISDGHSIEALGTNNIFGDVSRNPIGNRGPVIDLGLLAAGETSVPIDLDKGNFWHIKASFGAVQKARLELPTSSWGIKAGQELTLDCEIGLLAPAVGGGFSLATGWVVAGVGQGDILLVPQDGSWGYVADNQIGAEAAGKPIDNTAIGTFINTAAGTHTVMTLAWDGAAWRAKSRKTSNP